MSSGVSKVSNLINGLSGGEKEYEGRSFVSIVVEAAAGP